jgi:hypothetical protein
MNISLQSERRAFGVAGSLIGLLALIAAVLPHWVLPAVVPAAPAGQIAAERGHTLKERVVAKLKSITHGKHETGAQETRAEQSGLDEWRQRFSIAAISLALLAIALAVFSILRREEKLYAGVSAVLGGGAIAVQLAILFAGAVIAIMVLYAILKEPDAVIQPPVTAIGAVVGLVIAVLAMGLVSSQLAALVLGAAIVILIIYSILNGF